MLIRPSSKMNRSSLKIVPVAFLLVQLIGVGALDYYSGFELAIFPLYAIPVAFSVWYFNSATGIVVSLLCATLSFWADISAGQIYSEKWIRYENAYSILTLFLFVTLSFSYFKRTLRLARNKALAFSGPLPICTGCHKVCGRDGYWSDFENYIRENTDAVPQAKVCPECSRYNYTQSGPQSFKPATSS